MRRNTAPRRGQWGLVPIVAVSACILLWNTYAFLPGGAHPPPPAGKTRRRAPPQPLPPVTTMPGPAVLVSAVGQVIDPEDTDAWKQDGVTWFTILNAPRYYWCETLASAWHSGITMNIWGWGDKDFNGWLETWRKIPLAIEFSEGLGDGDLMGFVDGADTLFQKGIAQQVGTLREMEEDGRYNFVMSTEINCAVQSLPKHGCNDTVFPMTPWGRRYLNSGLYLGSAVRIREFLQFVQQYYLPRYRVGTVQRNDQSVIGFAWHSGWRENFTIDATTKLFQSVRMAEGHYCQQGQATGKLPVPDSSSGLLRNCLTNNTPSVFHFNGKAKPFLGKWIKKFWWYGKAIDPRAGVFVNKKLRSLKEMCPKLNYGTAPP